jgi:phthiocerol/phenolphthiocerol synthesis type-I polyketide synthase E
MGFRKTLLDLPRDGRPEPLTRALVELFAGNAEASAADLDGGTRLTQISEAWVEPVALHAVLEPWVTSTLEFGAFFDYELEGLTTIRELAEYLAVELDPAPVPTCSKGEDFRSALLPETPTGPYQGSDRVAEPTLFLLGAPRSGTTLLRAMLDGHPLVDAPPELHIVQFDTLGDWREAPGERRQHWSHHGLSQALGRKLKLSVGEAYALVDRLADRDLPIPRVYRLLHGREGATWLVDKSPGYAYHVEWMRRAEAMFVEPRFLHLIRHPYSVIASLVRMRMSKLLQGDLSGRVVNPWLAAEALWVRYNENMLRFESEVPANRWLRVRYEEVVTEPERVQRGICQFLGIGFDDAVLDPYQGDRLVEGIGDLNLRKRRRVEPGLADAWRDQPLPFAVSGRTRALARRLGYDLD